MNCFRGRQSYNKISTSQNQGCLSKLRVGGNFAPRIKRTNLYQHNLSRCSSSARSGKSNAIKFEIAHDSVVKLALQRYKELHFHSLVPGSFVIPQNNDEWPEAVWGLQLGKIMNEIRDASRKSMRNELETIGLNYNSKSNGKTCNRENLKLALLTYNKLHGSMQVPSAFVVPHDSDEWPDFLWGLNLGKIALEIREGVSRGPMRKELQAIGFIYTSYRGEKLPQYEAVTVALLTYKKLHGDMLVKPIFRVPDRSDDWPEECWNMRLGKHVTGIRYGKLFANMRGELESIGLDYTKQKVYKDEAVKQAIIRYKEIYGNFKMKYRFKIPDNSDKWPEITWGMPLGFVVHGIRHGRRPMLHNALDQMGFRSQAVSHDRFHSFQIIKRALLWYQILYGDMLVPRDFNVPTVCDSWPSVTWGVKLGKIASDIRGDRAHKSMKKELMKIKFDFGSQWVGQFNGFEAIKAALIQYKEVYGDMYVPDDFIVPHGSDDWIESSWGMVLGHIANRIRDGKRYVTKHDELNSIGFGFSSHRLRDRSETVKMALQLYENLYGNMLVPNKFIVPDEHHEWPEEMWGMTLGKTVNAMRAGNSHTSLRNDLSEIGFDYYVSKISKKIANPEVVMMAFDAYQEKYGNVLVPQDFCIPSNTLEWPQRTWGMKLGKANRQVLFGKKYDHENEKKKLIKLGFRYSSQRLLRTNGDAVVKLAIERYYTLFGDINIPYSYCIPDESVEWPEAVWGMAIGYTVSMMRLSGHYKNLKDQLVDEGYQFTDDRAPPNEYRIFPDELVKSAIIRFHEINGNLDIPIKMVVQKDDKDWPEIMWNLPLGMIYFRIRKRGSKPDLKKELEKMGYDVSKERQRGSIGYDYIASAFEIYKKVYGHVSVPNQFVIPNNDTNWPQKFWGAKLGRWAGVIRRGLYYTSKREELLKMGFDYSDHHNSRAYHLRILNSLKRYKELHGSLKMHRAFKVPTGSPLWDESLWGTRLGTGVTGIRYGIYLTAYRAEYEAIGLVYRGQSPPLNLTEAEGRIELSNGERDAEENEFDEQEIERV